MGKLNNKLYRYSWGNNEKRRTMKDRICKILATGSKCSALIEFTDNKQREIISRLSLRKLRQLKIYDIISNAI